ncbi:hypothetical protein MGYG_02889 [Nannizzia gypsea CBS 118893]|uniref:Alcohol acetyltransferase n=1 Tax=Arthroderma gypseum (strain ATCC MYA-4604 / CBS 118893) TaxID=535722 RepID=E4UPK2_ARTGP|nr:hypothetical protein MGYG_02889 [Nannizzia gypsea CBS 118893]EFQ99877.1 hypothetical protein MGYG_02889 [Nannizzia gypsea CBS 118893]
MDESKLEKLRPAGRLEKYSTARNPHRFYTNVAVTASYVLPSSCELPVKDCVYTALESLIEEHPALSAIPLAEDSLEPYFVRLPEVDVDQCVSFRERNAEFNAAADERDTELDELLTEQHNISFAAPLPYWRLCILTGPKDSRRFTASYFWHHAIGDGSSGKAFHKSLLVALKSVCSSSTAASTVKSVVESPKTPLLPTLEETCPMPMSFFFILSVWFRAKIWAPARDPALWAGSKMVTPLQNCIRHLVVSKRDATVFREVCRENKATVTAGLQTVLAQALFKQIPEQYTKLTCEGAISARRWLTDPSITDDSIGVWVHGYHEEYSRDNVCKSDNAFSWDEARRSKQTLDAVLSRRGKNSLTGMLKYAKDYVNELFLSKLGKEREKSFEVSNIGVFKADSDDQTETSPRIERMVFTQSANVFGCAISTSVITGADGCLVLGFSWQKGVVEDDLIDAFIASVKQTLGSFGEDRT